MLAGVVITKNEAKNLDTCLKGLAFCDQIYVVDTGSGDETLAIAKKYKAVILETEFTGDYAKLRNWAIAQVKASWILFVDADEQIDKKLASEIQTAVTKIEYKGFLFKRQDTLWGQTLKHGDVGSVKLLRLARRGSGNWQGRVHERWQVEDRVGTLQRPLMHTPHATLAEFLSRINEYSSIRAQELYAQGKQTSLGEIVLGPLWRFKLNYLFKLGFLDGTAGFVHAMVMSFYMFLVAGKLHLLHKGIRNG